MYLDSENLYHEHTFTIRMCNNGVARTYDIKAIDKEEAIEEARHRFRHFRKPGTRLFITVFDLEI